MSKDTYIARDGRLTIAELFARMRTSPKTFLAVSFLVTVAVIIHALTATPLYRGVVKMMPRETDAGMGEAQSIVAQLGGLAAMAGISLRSVSEQESIAWLKSRALFTLFLREQNLMPILFADQWDSAAARWRADLERQPTMDDAWALFDSIRRVSYDPNTRVITLDITWKDRQKTAEWANELARLANEELRQRALRESAASIASFQEQLSHADAVELQQAIYKLIEVQLNRNVLAKSRQDYALTIVDPAVVPDARRFVSPRRFLLLVISLPLGLFAGVCAVLGVQLAKQLATAIHPRQA